MVAAEALGDKEPVDLNFPYWPYWAWSHVLFRPACSSFKRKAGVLLSIKRKEKVTGCISNTCEVQGRVGKDVLCNVLRLAALRCRAPQQETRDPLSTRTETTGLPSSASSTTMWHCWGGWGGVGWGACDKHRGEELPLLSDKRRGAGGAEEGMRALLEPIHLQPWASSAEVVVETPFPSAPERAALGGARSCGAAECGAFSRSSSSGSTACHEMSAARLRARIKVHRANLGRWCLKSVPRPSWQESSSYNSGPDCGKVNSGSILLHIFCVMLD